MCPGFSCLLRHMSSFGSPLNRPDITNISKEFAHEPVIEPRLQWSEGVLMVFDLPFDPSLLVPGYSSQYKNRVSVGDSSETVALISHE
jgi:hypothetical protein